MIHNLRRDSKVNKLDLGVFCLIFEEKVLGFEIPVDNPSIVEVNNRAQQLLDVHRGLLLRKRVDLLDPVEQLPARAKPTLVNRSRYSVTM